MKTTKTILNFLNADGDAILYTNEVEIRDVQQMALKYDISINKMLGKKVKYVTDFNAPMTAVQYL